MRKQIQQLFLLHSNKLEPFSSLKHQSVALPTAQKCQKKINSTINVQSFIKRKKLSIFLNVNFLTPLKMQERNFTCNLQHHPRL